MDDSQRRRAFKVLVEVKALLERKGKMALAERVREQIQALQSNCPHTQRRTLQERYYTDRTGWSNTMCATCNLPLSDKTGLSALDRLMGEDFI